MSPMHALGFGLLGFPTHVATATSHFRGLALALASVGLRLLLVR